MYPHERSLVDQYKDRPFVLIGVNSDEDREKLKPVLEKERITWRSFWNGGGRSGPISSAWNVHGWPTLYILDKDGTIRFKCKGADEQGIDKTLESLLAAAQAPPK